MAQVRTRKRGKTWSFIFEAGIVNGKRKVVEKGGFPTKDAAYKAGVEKYTDFIHGNIGIASEAITLKDFMTQWLNEVVAVNVKARSMQTYQTLSDRQICPYLGEVKVQELTPAMLDAWIRNLQKTGLSFNTLTATHALIHHALDYAVHPARLINSNPSDYIKVPKNAPRNVIKRTIITLEQFKALLEKNPFGTQYYIPLVILYHTGMRIGEVLGLSWEDIDFDQRRINVRQQIVHLKKHGYFLTTPKTESSVRYILMGEELISELKRWQRQQGLNEENIGDSYVYIYREDNGHIMRQSRSLPAPLGKRISLICTRNDGRLILYESLTIFLKGENLNAHSFRHTHATQLIENGVEAKAVAGRLGHANTQITQNLYTHNTLKLQEKALAIFDKILQTNT